MLVLRIRLPENLFGLMDVMEWYLEFVALLVVRSLCGNHFQRYRVLILVVLA